MRTKKDARALKPTLEPLLPTILKEYDIIILLMGNLYESVFIDYLGGPLAVKFVLSADHRGSGGYNQLITRLNLVLPKILQDYLSWLIQLNDKITVGTINAFNKTAQQGHRQISHQMSKNIL